MMNKIVWWLITTSLCSGGRILDEIVLQNPQPAWNKMSELIKLCFSERTNPVVITDDLVDTIYGVSRDIDHPNVNVIDRDYRARKIQIFNPAYPTYILSANSASQLKDLLLALKSSPTWSTNSAFFIIGTNKESCGNASKMLQVLWKMNLISAFYVCYETDDKDTMILYTYNPFTNRAPEPWVEVEPTDRPDNRWSLYKQPFIDVVDKEACKSLTYDKTKYLDGYKVKAVSKSLLNYTRGKIYDLDSVREHNKYQSIMYHKTLFSALNVTPIVYYSQSGYWINNTASGFLKELMNGTYHLALDVRKLETLPEIDLINLNRQTYFTILTQRIRIVRTIKNYETYLNFGLIGVIILILVVSFVILVIHNGRDYGNGFLNIIRISIGSGTDAPLDKLPVRVIFIMTTLLFFVVSPQIQGHLFSYTTKPEQSYPQNLEDLKDFKFNIYYPAHVEYFIVEQTSIFNLNKTYLRLFSYHPSNCHGQVLNDSSNACLNIIHYQINAAYNYNLHLAKKKLNPSFITYWTKKDWVLMDRVNKVTSKFLEIGIFDLWDKQESNYIFEKFKAKEIIDNADAGYDKIEFENLKSTYLFIFLCFFLGTLIFVAEILIVKYKVVLYRRTILRTLKRRIRRRLAYSNKIVVSIC